MFDLLSMDALKSKQVDVDELSKYSNIGEVGINLVDYSDNYPANEFQNSFPLVEWLMTTPISRQSRTAMNDGSFRPFKGADGKWHILTPVKFGTTPPEDTTGECCWIPFNLTKCMSDAVISFLCLKDCYPELDRLIGDQARFKEGDMTNFFQRQGETYNQARDRMARLSMAWFTAHNIILGTLDTETPVLKPFHGLLDVMSGADVIQIGGTDIISAFESVSCREALMSDADVFYAVHPLVYEGIKSVIRVGQYGELPEGWTKVDGELRFNGHRFIVDKMVPVNMETGTGDIWVLDRNTLGVFLGTGLEPSDNFTKETFAPTNNREDGCASECKYYYNYGTVFATDTNKLAVITEVPIGTNCLGSALNGLDLLVTPETIVPIDVE